MFPHMPTETEIMKNIIEANAPKQEQEIQQLLSYHDSMAKDLLEGTRYYLGHNDIQDRIMYDYDTETYYDENGEQKTNITRTNGQDPDEANNKLNSGWHKLMVDQKVAYLVGDPLVVSKKDSADISDEDMQVVMDELGEEFNDVIPELVKQSSNKGKEWLHPYIKEDGTFDYMRIPAQEGIPLYESKRQRDLLGFIRTYHISPDIRKVELWDENKVTYYEEIDGELHLDANEEENPASHFYFGTSKQRQGYGWGQVPFIEFRNNEEAVSDLTFYKTYVDAYDVIMSDMTNTLEDMQSLIFVLKGYEGQDAGELRKKLKKIKAVPLSADPGVGLDTVSADPPTNAVTEQLNRLSDNIIQFGQGVDTSTDKFGNSPSGIALKFLFSALDMKANALERKFAKGLQRFMWFVCEYIRLRPDNPRELDHTQFTYTFNKSMLMNDKEQVEIAEMSKDILSKETLLKNHPWVDNVEEEVQRVEDQEDEYRKMLRKENPLNDPRATNDPPTNKEE